MSFSLILNSSNVQGSNNNRYQYKFINGSFTVTEDMELSISSLTIPYSWYNFTKSYDNLTFNIKWVNTGATVQTITLPEGFYSISDLNSYIQQICITNGWYLVDSSGNNVYYLVLSTNTNYYKIQMLLMAVPTALPTGYTQPSNWPGYPASTITPQFSLNASGSIASVIGFATGTTWGGGASSVSVLSSSTPNITQVNSLVIQCSLVDNPVIFPSDILDTIPITSTYGSNIYYNPTFEKWIKMRPGAYQYIDIKFADQNLNPLNALDSNVLINLLIRKIRN